MTQKLSWSEIETQYDKEWVQLIDFDWPEEEAYPRSGVVRVHAKSRKEFDKLILQDPPSDSALVYVGERILPPNTIYSLNMHRVEFKNQ